MDPLTLAASATAEELTFQCGNDKELRAKFWKTGGDVPASERRRFIALHGFMDNAGSFDPIAPLLLQQLGPEPVEIVALDLAGHGLSTHRKSEDYFLWRYVEDVHLVVELLGWTRHCILGHSIGGAISSLYAGLYADRVVLTVLLDVMGPLVAPETTQPDLLLSHFAKRKAILSTPLPFIPSIQAAIALRGQGEVYGIQPEFAQLLMPRGLRPLVKLQDEATTRMGEEEKGQKKKGVVLQGWTLRSDPLLEAIKETQYVSEGYAKTFMGRIQCPVLCILASKNLARPKMAKLVKLRAGWMSNAESLTIQTIEGNHSFHMEHADLVALAIGKWVKDVDLVRGSAASRL